MVSSNSFYELACSSMMYICWNDPHPNISNSNSIKREYKRVYFNSQLNTIVLLRDVFHIGLVIGPRPAVLA